MKKINKKEQFRNARARLLNKDFPLLGYWIYVTLYLLLHQKGPSFCLCVVKFPNNFQDLIHTERYVNLISSLQIFWKYELGIGTTGCRKFKPITKTLPKSCLSKTAFYKQLDLFFNKEIIKAFLPKPQFTGIFIRKHSKNLII